MKLRGPWFVFLLDYGLPRVVDDFFRPFPLRGGFEQKAAARMVPPVLREKGMVGNGASRGAGPLLCMARIPSIPRNSATNLMKGQLAKSANKGYVIIGFIVLPVCALHTVGFLLFSSRRNGRQYPFGPCPQS